MTNLKIKTTDNREVEIKIEVTATSINFSYRINDMRKWVSQMTPALMSERFVKFAEFKDGDWNVASSMMANVEVSISSFLKPSFDHFKKEIAIFMMPTLHEAHQEILVDIYQPTKVSVVGM